MIQTDRMHLMIGDCLERMKEIPDGSVDMVLTDPPYGTTACKWDSVIPLEPMWAHLKRVIKPNGAIVMTASQPFTSALIMSNTKMFKYEWIWEKTKASGHLNAKKRPLSAHENIVIFNSKTYNPQGLKGVNKKQNKQPKKVNGDNVYRDNDKSTMQRLGGYPRSVIAFSKPSKPLHPTQKPVALMEYLIKTYTNPDETVLDFTMGSGTTGVAAMNLNRKFIGIELDPTYYGIACGRVVGAVPYEI